MASHRLRRKGDAGRATSSRRLSGQAPEVSGAVPPSLRSRVGDVSAMKDAADQRYGRIRRGEPSANVWILAPTLAPRPGIGGYDEA
jgi:hypothetical protein